MTHGQGIIGLRRAFALAGAKSLLLTLWPVADEPTAQMMIAFYRNLYHLSPAEALHRAQREVAKQLSDENGFANPRLWAPFILQSAIGFESNGAPP